MNYENHTKHIAKHYAHAVSKHKDFVHKFVDETIDAVAALKASRDALLESAIFADISTNDILACEVAEIYEAYARGDVNATIEECYDTVAVLLRMIDVLRGEQKLTVVPINEKKAKKGGK